MQGVLSVHVWSSPTLAAPSSGVIQGCMLLLHTIVLLLTMSEAGQLCVTQATMCWSVKFMYERLYFSDVRSQTSMSLIECCACSCLHPWISIPIWFAIEWCRQVCLGKPLIHCSDKIFKLLLSSKMATPILMYQCASAKLAKRRQQRTIEGNG